jgi:hypothetical protein
VNTSNIEGLSKSHAKGMKSGAVVTQHEFSFIKKGSTESVPFFSYNFDVTE